MSFFNNFIDPYLRYRSLLVRLRRSDYYKLQMIADDLNEHLDEDYQITPELIATKVMKTFIDEAYGDSTRRIVKAILPGTHHSYPRKR